MRGAYKSEFRIKELRDPKEAEEMRIKDPDANKRFRLFDREDEPSKRKNQ